MEITEETRHRLYQRLEEVLEPEEATTLMAHLPPVGWADVATKHDLRALEQRLDLRFGSLEDRLELRIDASESRVRAELQRDLRLQGFALLAGLSAVNAAALAISQLL
jgi:hypothetical protein